jgi:hypothetical protein
MRPRGLFAFGATLAVLGIAAPASSTYEKPGLPPGTPPAPLPEFELPATGKNIPREKGGWLNIEFPGPFMLVRFFDAEKRPTVPDVPRATVRFRLAMKSGVSRTVLSRSGDVLISPDQVRAPHNFIVTLTLVSGEELPDDGLYAGENYTFKYP